MKFNLTVSLMIAVVTLISQGASVGTNPAKTKKPTKLTHSSEVVRSTLAQHGLAH